MQHYQQQAPVTKRQQYLNSCYQYFWIIVALWVVEIGDRLFFNQGLEAYGIYPGNWNHWQGIILSPLLHGDIGHLMGNSIPLLILGALILLRGWEALVTASLVSAGVAGLVIMFIGNPASCHIGASSVVYGYFGFLIAQGLYLKTPLSILIAGGVIFVYWGAIHTMYPNEITQVNRISWEAHLGGALGGLLAAKILFRGRR